MAMSRAYARAAKITADYYRETQYLYLEDILPDIKVDYADYVKCENEIISPALESAGYNICSNWFTGDGDSFGPLTRCIITNKGTIVYG